MAARCDPEKTGASPVGQPPQRPWHRCPRE